MHARYYDPTTGQFISPDTVVPDAGQVLGYNRYLYANANPLQFNDPSGYESCAAGNDACWEQEWQWKNRWYNAHGFSWNTTSNDWSMSGEPSFADEDILNDTMAEAGISWNNVPGDPANWTFARKKGIAAGIVRLGNFISGGLVRLSGLLGGYATMVIATGGNILCNGGRVPCSMPTWDHAVVWPADYVDRYDGSSYLSGTAVHELAHVMDWQSGRSFSTWWKRNSPVGQYGNNCDGNPCVVKWERWAEAVQVAVYGQNAIGGALPVGGAELATQVDLVRGMLGGWIQP